MNGRMNIKIRKCQRVPLFFFASTGESELNKSGISISKSMREKETVYEKSKNGLRKESDFEHRTSCVFVRLATRFRVLFQYTVKLEAYSDLTLRFSSDTASSYLCTLVCLMLTRFLQWYEHFCEEKKISFANTCTLCKKPILCLF